MDKKVIFIYKNWPGKNLTEYRLAQDEYLRNLKTFKPVGQSIGKIS